jgi:phage baseplate assembly protein W
VITIPRRTDYDHPLHVDGGSGQIAQAAYSAHLDQLLIQLLLTTPGERVNLPTFGCGLRQLLFAGQSAALTANVKIQVSQSVSQWLADQIQLTDVEVVAGAAADPSLGLSEGEILVTVSYLAVETQTPAQVSVRVG